MRNSRRRAARGQPGNGGSVVVDTGGGFQRGRVAVGVDAPRGQHRLGRRVRVILEMRSVQEQIVQLDVVEATRRPRLELGLDLLAHPRHRRLRHRGPLAERLHQGGLHITDRQAAHEPGDHQRLQRVGLGHALPEQLRGEPLGGAAHLRPGQRHRAHGGLHRYLESSRQRLRCPTRGVEVPGCAWWTWLSAVVQEAERVE